MEEAARAALKKRIKDARNRLELHVSLLMHQQGLSKPDATILAYLHGVNWLDDFLAMPAKT